MEIAFFIGDVKYRTFVFVAGVSVYERTHCCVDSHEGLLCETAIMV